MVIVIGSGLHEGFAEKITEHLKQRGKNAEMFLYELTEFKGFSAGGINIGERKIRFPEKLIDALERDDEAILVVRGRYGLWNSDAIFMETCQLIDTLKSGLLNMKGKRVKRLCLVMPKEGYVKQDKVFSDDNGKPMFGESISIATQRKAFKLLGADMLITVYPHDFRLPEDREGWIKTETEGHVIQDWTGFAWAVNPVRHVAEFFIKKGIKIDAVIAPDRGAYEFSSYIAGILEAESSYIDSHRMRSDPRIIVNKKEFAMDLAEKNVLLVDDWILTGSKIKNAIDALLKGGENFSPPKSIHVAVIHGELTGNTYDELMKRGIKLYCTNTMKNPAENIDITPLIADRIERLFLN